MGGSVMDKRIITKYVTDVIDQAPHNRDEAIEELANVLYIAFNGNIDQSKSLIINALLEIDQ
jgi:hypothetical protein